MPKGFPLRPRPLVPSRAILFIDSLHAAGNDCVLWPFACDRCGYGVTSLDRKTMKAHRVSYMCHVGRIPDGMLVLHACDTPACVNPRHLHVGTHQQNMREREERGRAPLGTAYRHAILNPEIVRAIRSGQKSACQWARELGCALPTISAARDRFSWKHVE